MAVNEALCARGCTASATELQWDPVRSGSGGPRTGTHWQDISGGAAPIRAIAASFSDALAAEAALDGLRRRLVVTPGQVRLARLGHPSYPVVPDTVLAGRFDEADVAAVREVVERFGGRVLTDVDNDWT